MSCRCSFFGGKAAFGNGKNAACSPMMLASGTLLAFLQQEHKSNANHRSQKKCDFDGNDRIISRNKSSDEPGQTSINTHGFFLPFSLLQPKSVCHRERKSQAILLRRNIAVIGPGQKLGFSVIPFISMVFSEFTGYLTGIKLFMNWGNCCNANRGWGRRPTSVS